MGRFWSQPELDPFKSGGRKIDLQPPAGHHGSGRLSLGERTVASVEYDDERRRAEENISLCQSNGLSPDLSRSGPNLTKNRWICVDLSQI